VNDENPKVTPASLADAVYYHNDVFGSKILVRILRAHLQGNVLEVGAGAGYITSELALRAQRVVAIEPTSELHEQLSERTALLPNVSVVNGTLRDYVAQADSPGPVPLFDAIVYINVLEHIEADAEELALAKELLHPGGSVLIVVPAHQWLYARVDQLTGHFRRYSKRSLCNIIASSGLEVRELKYFDAVGLFPYLVLYRWLRSTSTSGANAALYSRVIMPISYIAYRVFGGRLLGKNLIVVAGTTQTQKRVR
jgi:protein-L-isoaspartate O-methyltransferase